MTKIFAFVALSSVSLLLLAQVPAGFTVSEFASGFAKPRYLLEGPSGEILLTFPHM